MEDMDQDTTSKTNTYTNADANPGLSGKQLQQIPSARENFQLGFGSDIEQQQSKNKS